MGRTFVGFILAIAAALGACSIITGGVNIGATLLPTPQYIRSAEFDNQCGSLANIELTFESGESESNELLDGQQKLVEKMIDMGGWSAVDPITSMSVSIKGVATSITEPALGVEKRMYTINSNGTLTRNK